MIFMVSILFFQCYEVKKSVAKKVPINFDFQYKILFKNKAYHKYSIHILQYKER